MISSQANDPKEILYRQMKERIAGSYPRGWFVALAADQVLAAAPDFHSLESLLRAQGKVPRDVLVVEAGIEYPEQATIFI